MSARLVACARRAPLAVALPAPALLVGSAPAGADPMTTIDKAIHLDPESEYFREQRRRFAGE